MDVSAVAIIAVLFGGYLAWFVQAVRNDGQGWRRPPRPAEDHWSAPDGPTHLPDQPFSELVAR